MSRGSDLTSMTVSLPVAQKAYVQAQATESGCSTPSEYIRRLIHADQRAREQEQLERRVLEGIASPSREMTPEAWQDLRRTLREALSGGKKPGKKATSSRPARPGPGWRGGSSGTASRRRT